MGCTLTELRRRMTGAEFQLHLQHELAQQPQQGPEELIWQEGGAM